METQYNKLAEKLIWYLDECIINIQHHSDTIEMINEKKNSFKIKNNLANSKELKNIIKEWKSWEINLNENNIKILEQAMFLMAAEKQTSIFSYTLLKWMITSYFSIFEHYIYFIWNELNLPKDKNESFEDYLNKKIWKSLDFWNLSELWGQEIFKRYREFYLRRNLYIHNYWFITEEYIEDINRKQLIDVIPKYYEQIEYYKIWNILPIDWTYLMMNWNSLNVIWISITILYVNRNFEEKYFLKILEIVYNFLLNNSDYEVTYIMIYSLLEDKLKLKTYTNFTLWYMIAIRKITWKMKYKKAKKFKSNFIDEYIKELNPSKLDIIQKIIYFWILEKNDQILELIKNNTVTNKNCNIISKMYSYDFLCDFIINNSIEFKNLYNKFWWDIKASKNTTINHIKKIQEIQNILLNK